MLLGSGLTITYQHRAPAGERTLQVTGERAAVFLEASPGQPAEGERSVPASRVRGFYIEGDVIATDGVNTVRAPRVYYSVKDNRALLLDAVFWTYDQRRQLPLYVRARSLEQLSTEEFRATGARISNTPFFEPDLSVGVSSVTITRRGGGEGPALPGPAGPEGDSGEPDDPESRGSDVYIDARNITLRAGGIPFFYWPRVRGDPAAVPLRDIRLENSSGSGTALKTTWDFYSLVGVRATPGNSADLIVDGYFERGLGLGTDLRWRTERGRGGLFAYFLPQDTGTDILQTGQRESQDGDARGMVLAEHRAALSERWTLFAEGSYISDETFIPGFFEPMARNRREFTNSLSIRRLDEASLLFGEVRARSTDFIANEALLQSPGYTVMRYPDLGYARFADDLIQRHPGLLTYSSQYRFTQMRMEFADPRVEQIGFRSPARADALFGVAPGQSIADALRARGLSEDPVGRFDTRHELSAQLAAGPVSITPFLVGRATVYDDTFESFSPDADEYYRLWSAQGVTFSTEVSKVNDAARSRLLDVHRIRHIIQPSITLWHAATTVDRTDLPVFDDDVESLAEGSAARFAIDQTWQTQRGAPGRWRSVDVLRLSTSLVVSGGEVEKESPIGRYFDYRPELSNLGGTFATVEGAWQVSEVLGIGGETVYDFDIGQQARSVLGYTLRHERAFSTFGEVRYINALDQTYALLGAHYDLTSKYSVAATGSYDTVRSEFQSVSLDIRRRLPNVILGTGVSYNNITGVTSFGFVFQPVGFQRQGARFRAGGPAGGGF
ncbi:MAG: hypothetical protein WD749_01755 [Phycisphaerales bacterium]